MRRTRWAVFTTMNEPQSAWRSLYEPAAERENGSASDVSQDADAVRTEPSELRPGASLRRDRADL